MNQFMYGLSSMTTALQPVMIFITLMAIIFFIFYLKRQLDLFIQYHKSIMISLQQIANQKNRSFNDTNL